MSQEAIKVTYIAPTKPKVIRESVDVKEQKLRVAAYARVSTEQDEQQSSYEAQVDYYTQYIESNPNWKFVGVFADEGISGTSMKSREGFKSMIAVALNGEIDLILTKSISRFARNTVDTLRTVRKLKEKGIEVIFEKENLHTMDPKCEMMLTIFSSLAQEESRSISENVRWGKQKSMRDGNVHVAYSHFLGYTKGEDGRLEIVEEEAKIIRKIYSLFLEGNTVNEIARILTAEGIPTPMKRKKWSVSTVESILSNEKYKGEALLQKTYTVDFLSKKVRKNDGDLPQYHVANSHEAIIEPEVFDRVQAMIAERKPHNKRKYSKRPFAQKLVCGDCGCFFGHKVWHNHANTEKYDVWYCNHRYDGEEKCSTPTLKESEIKAAFERLLYTLEDGETAYSDERWRETVEAVIVKTDCHLEFHLKDGIEVIIAL